jgi:hypothetical protein
MAGDLLRLPWLKAIGAASTASPAPRVFSAVQGYETYSTRFTLEWNGPDRWVRSLTLTPLLYARIRGPYNRRNVYGAVVAYGPVLASDPRTRPLFESVARAALFGDAPLLRELLVDPRGVHPPVRLHYEPAPGRTMGGFPHLLEVPPP